MSIEEQIQELATKLNLTIGIAEATTGGQICGRIVRVPGSSGYFERGIIAYSKQSKMDLLGMTEEYLSEHGAVSAKAAEAMAEGVRRNAGTDLGLAESGIAGPIRGRSPKPIGTGFISISSAEGIDTRSFQFSGDRAEIQDSIADAALETLLEYLTKLDQKIESPPA
ncbi:MAG: CinA family protein [Planctomycetota bacterium]|nr:CinA family protein [Planctomycetota bacterium]MDA1138908.1 CinA family protein [Planctomycetota bacterium]